LQDKKINKLLLTSACSGFIFNILIGILNLYIDIDIYFLKPWSIYLWGGACLFISLIIIINTIFEKRRIK